MQEFKCLSSFLQDRYLFANSNQIFVTYSQALEMRYLVEAQIPKDCLILADSAEWTESIKQITEYCDFSAIITSSTTDYYSLSTTVKRNGKCVFIGTGSNIPDLSTIASSIFARGASIILLDMLDLFEKSMYMKTLVVLPLCTEQLNVSLTCLIRFVKEVFEIYSNIGHHQLHTPNSFDISDFGKAITNALSPDTMGKTIIRYEPMSEVPTLVVPEFSTFDSCATFLMVGCLGGLGRSLVYVEISSSVISLY